MCFNISATSCYFYMLERCSYVRCLMIDFSKAFDLVDHPILLGKLASLGLPDRAINWIISYLTGRTQVVKCDGSVSSTVEINTSIIHRSRIGPMLYVVMESDLCTVSTMNVIVKYADDTNLCHLTLTLILSWAMENRMVVNILKTKEVVFRRPNPRLDVCPVALVALVGVKQVVSAKLLGIVLSQTLRFDIHVNGILKLCSQRILSIKITPR